MAKKSNSVLEKILECAETERVKLKHPYVGSEHLFLAIIKENNSLSRFLKNYNLTYDNFKKELISVVGSCTKDYDINLYTPLLRKIIKRYKNKHDSIDQSDISEDIFLSMLDEGEGIAIRIILKMDIDLDEIYITLKEKKKLRNMDITNQVGILLNTSINLNDKVIGREEEINKLIMTLTRKKKCNPILIGPAGVGKTAIVEELTRRICKNEVPDELKNYKVIMIEMGSLISGTKYRGEFEERLNKIIKEIVNNQKTIIFIDEIHSMISAGGAEGAISASDILKPYLARGEIKCIGATTTIEYKNTILKDKALSRRFDTISVKEPTKDEMYNLLIKIKNEYEMFHKIKIPNSMISKIIDLSDYYLKSIVNPDKSIDLLDSSCAYAKINGHSGKLTEQDIINTIFYKTNNCIINNSNFINNLKNDLKKFIGNKDINKLCIAFNYKPNIPISILIDENIVEDTIKRNLNDINMINVDLSSYEYNVINSLSDNKTVNDTIFNSLIDKPFSLVIFHNIGKANRCILNEITKINNDGYIELKDNEKIYFNNAIIIASLNEKNKAPGFSKKALSSSLPDEFIKSFQCDIRNIKLKEIASL